MAAGDLITEDYQLEYNDILIGSTTTGLEVVEFSPFESPDVRSSDLVRPQDHGLFPGTDYYSGRSIMLEIEAWGGWDAVTNVLNAFQTQTDEIPLVFQLPDIGKLRANVRVRRRSAIPINMEYVVAEKTPVIIEFFATDPRLYSNTLKSNGGDLVADSSGMTFNATFDLSFGVGASPTVSVENEGTFETRPTVEITGPITDPYIENQTTGKSLAFTGELASTDTLTIDFLNRSVYLNGTSSRYGWIDDPSQWWTLVPGANSIRFGGTAGATTPSFTIQWRDAYL